MIKKKSQKKRKIHKKKNKPINHLKKEMAERQKEVKNKKNK